MLSSSSPLLGEAQRSFASPLSSPLAADLLPLIGALLGPDDLLALCACSESLNVSVTGSPLATVWQELLGELSRPLLSNVHSPMRRYMQLMSLDLTGTWLDAGINVHEREKYRYLTAMRVTRQSGLEKSFEAVSFLGDREVKISRGRLDGAVYVCYERFEDIETGEMVSAPINMARGVLDLRDPERPTISGMWIQCDPPPDGEEDGGEELDKWLDNPLCLTTGSFEFTKLDAAYDERAGWNPELRLRAGLPALDARADGVPVSASLYVVEPFHDDVPLCA